METVTFRVPVANSDGHVFAYAPVTRHDFTEEIDRGVALLDRWAPGWYASVRTESLQLENTRSCVLGQLAMKDLREQIEKYRAIGGWRDDAFRGGLGYSYNYNDAADALGLYYNDAAAQYGFTIPRDSSPLLWEELTFQWRDRIEKLRADAGVTDGR